MTDIVKQARKLIIEKRELDTNNSNIFNKILAEKMAVAVIEASRDFEELKNKKDKCILLS